MNYLLKEAAELLDGQNLKYAVCRGLAIDLFFEGNCIALMNGHFDTENPDKVIHKGEYID